MSDSQNTGENEDLVFCAQNKKTAVFKSVLSHQYSVLLFEQEGKIRRKNKRPDAEEKRKCFLLIKLETKR